MIDKLFSRTCVLFLLTLWAGMAMAAINGNETGFDLRPAIPFWQRITGQAGYAVDLANGKVEDKEGNKPITQIAKDRATEAKKALEAAREPTSSSVPLPDGVGDTRLAVCPNGSVEPQNAKEISSTIMSAFKLKVEAKQIKSYLDVQAALGNPACSWKVGEINKWRHIGKGGVFVDTNWTDKTIEVKLSGF